MIKPKTHMREDWRPDVGCLQKVRDRYPRIDLEHYIEEMRDHYLGNGKTMKCWNATFRNWIRRSGNFGPVVSLKFVPVKNSVSDNVVELGTIHAARERGIETKGKTESQLSSEIWNYDQKKRIDLSSTI